MKTQSDFFDRVGGWIGFWSASFSALLAIIYVAAELAHLLGLLGPHNSNQSFVLRMTPSLFLALAFVILMVSIHYYASRAKRIWSHIGLVFAIIYAVLVSTVYFVVLTVVIPYTSRGEADKVALLAFGFGTFLFAINVLGYGFMSLSTLFAAPVFEDGDLARWIRWCLALNGLLAPAIPLQILYPPLWNVAALWAVTFPLSTVLLGVLFWRNTRTSLPMETPSINTKPKSLR